MTIRKNFNNEIKSLKEKVLYMSSLAEQSFQDAIFALKNQDQVLAHKLIERDKAINDMEEEIEELVVKLISTQQPVASDLRKIIATLKMASSIERIGDFAVDIAKATKRIGTNDIIHSIEDLPMMLDIVQNMIRKGMIAYTDENVSLAEEMAAMDDQVDKIYAGMIQRLMEVMMDQPDKKEEVIQIAFVIRYIERIADHTTNIAEAILYIVKGKRVDLNK